MPKRRVKKTKIERVVIYARVSTAEQAAKALSIPAQVRHASEYADRKGYTVVGTYEEHGVSGTSSNRPVLNKMLQEIVVPDADIDAVVVYMSSRFMRGVAESQATKTILAKHGIRVVSSSQETPEGPMGAAFELMAEVYDELESSLIGARTRSGLNQCAHDGYFPGSHPPFGFARKRVLDGKAPRWKLIPNHEEVPALVEVFKDYVGGLGAKATCRNLNRRGLTYRGKPWSKDKIMKVIGETAAVGTYYWGKKNNKTRLWREKDGWIPIEVEPIIDRELFNMAQKLRASRDPENNVGRNGSSPLLLARPPTGRIVGASHDSISHRGGEQEREIWRIQRNSKRTYWPKRWAPVRTSRA